MFGNKVPLVSIITVNYNGTDFTCDLLSSIKRQNKYTNIEVIVVDNASLEDPTQKCHQVLPSAKIIKSDRNLGFSGGNNLGIKAATGDFLFLVNNDTEFTPGLIDGLLEIFHNYPKAGIVSPKFHYFFQKGTIEFAGYTRIDIFTGRNGMVGMGENDRGQYDKVLRTNYAHGGGMMVSRKAIDAVGLMPEEYFLYYEELDWSSQFRKKGYEIYYQPNSLIYHKESMSTGKNSPLKTFYLTRNRILFMARNVNKPSFFVFLLYFAIFTVPKNTLQFLFKLQFDHLRSFWKGIIWHLDRKIVYH